MKINNEKSEFNKCSFLERVHDLLNISIIFLDISIAFLDISAISNDISISNDIFSIFLQVFVLNEIQFLSDSLDCVCFEHSKFVHRVRYIIYTHQQTFTHNNTVRTHDISSRHTFILRNRRSNTAERNDRASTAERSNRATAAEKDDEATTAKRDNRATARNNSARTFKHFVQSESWKITATTRKKYVKWYRRNYQLCY